MAKRIAAAAIGCTSSFRGDVCAINMPPRWGRTLFL